MKAQGRKTEDFLKKEVYTNESETVTLNEAFFLKY